MSRRILRRSFLARVAGGIALLAAAAPARPSVRPPRRGLCSDEDSGPRADPANARYGDRDSGPGSDPLGPRPDNLTDGDVGRYSDHRQIPNIGACPAKKRRRGETSEEGERG